MTASIPAHRSWLSVPGSSEKMLSKAAGLGADQFVLDLEDAVVPARKDHARAAVLAALQAGGWAEGTITVRINAPRTAWCDLDVVAMAGSAIHPRAVLVPKVESVGDLAFIDRLLDSAEARSSRTVPIRIQALIETAAGLARVQEIAAASPRLEGLVLGYADLAASLGRSDGGAARLDNWHFAQEAVLVAARTRGLLAIDGPYLGVEVDSTFEAAIARARDIGYDGKWAIHPRQVEAINDAFTPTAAELAAACDVIAALEEADRNSEAGAVRMDGRMLDEALRVSAVRTLAEGRQILVTGTVVPPIRVGGPFFEDLERGYVELGAPAATLTSGLAAAHTAILGHRLRLPLDGALARRVTGTEEPIAHPGLVCDIAIGQSTLVTQRVIANLFYRGLVFRRMPVIGDTLRTTTEVVALKQNRRRKPGLATGLVALKIVTIDQVDRPVLDFVRCAMLPLRDPGLATGHEDDIDAVAAASDTGGLAAAVAGWRLSALRDGRNPAFTDLRAGTSWDIVGGDVVTSAPELARLSLNVAMAHHDRTAGTAGLRLVYGGHTIGLAAAQASRALPNLATIVAWHGCDHVAPVFEGDTLTSRLDLERCDPLPGGGGLLHLRSRVRALRAASEADESHLVLDWRFVAVHP